MWVRPDKQRWPWRDNNLNISSGRLRKVERSRAAQALWGSGKRLRVHDKFRGQIQIPTLLVNLSYILTFFFVSGIIRLFYFFKDGLFLIKAINEAVSSCSFPLVGICGRITSKSALAEYELES